MNYFLSRQGRPFTHFILQNLMAWRHANIVRFSDDVRTIVPNVAKSWKWNDDYTEITFALRKGHRWSDGEPFTTDDVVFYMNDIILNEDIHKATPSPMPAIGLPSCILAAWLKWPPPKHSIIRPGTRILKRSCRRSHPMTPN